MASRLCAGAARLCVAASRQSTQVAGLRTGGKVGKEYAPVPVGLANRMKVFQLPNNLPVHIKGGPIDKLLYLVTAIVCTVGVLECFHVYYVLSYPAKKD